MLKRTIATVFVAALLCLLALPATALATAPNGQVIYVGNENVTSGGYWTTDSAGNVTQYNEEGKPSNNYIHYNTATNTLTLHNATIKEEVPLNTSTYVAGAAIGVHNQNGAAELTITLEGTNTIEDVSAAIHVFASSTGAANLTITGSGSLDASGSYNPGIRVQSNTGNGTLTITGAKVTASSSNGGNGVQIRCGEGSDASLTVNDGSLTATGSGNYSAGINLQFGSGDSGSGTPTVIVSNNAIVRANGGIATNSTAATPSGTGIVFDGRTGTVYGDVTLQENITIGEGESLKLDDGASLSAGGHNVIVDGGTVDESLKTSLGDKVKYAPTITTTTLSSGTMNQSYTAQLSATGSDTIKWSLATGSSLPSNLTLSESGEISGTPTATGTSTFTVVATNDYGFESKEFTLTIDKQGTIHVTNVSLSQTELSLTKGNTAQLTATVKPDNATNRNVTWTSSAPNVATVDSGGTVTAVAPGTATITVTTADGNKTAACAVTVKHSNMVLTPQKDATCTEDGNKEYWTCETCGKYFSDETGTTEITQESTVIPATGHTFRGGWCAVCGARDPNYVPPANPNYRIDVTATEGGAVTKDPAAAKAGETVTLTPAPEEGYEVGEVTVTDRFGDAVAVTENADGTYTFTMPSGQVKVAVTFVEAVPEPLPFTDVAETDWFHDAVRYVYDNGLMDGVGDGQFAPNATTNRAMVVTILYRLAGEPAVSGDVGFTDVESGLWYSNAVLWAAQKGIVNGISETEFSPSGDLTREQLATVLYRYAEGMGYDVSASADLSSFPDADQIQSYATEALSWAVAEGLLQGFEDDSLQPGGTATRAQIATILMRFLAAAPTA